MTLKNYEAIGIKYNVDFSSSEQIVYRVKAPNSDRARELIEEHDITIILRTPVCKVVNLEHVENSRLHDFGEVIKLKSGFADGGHVTHNNKPRYVMNWNVLAVLIWIAVMGVVWYGLVSRYV